MLSASEVDEIELEEEEGEPINFFGLDAAGLELGDELVDAAAFEDGGNTQLAGAEA